VARSEGRSLPLGKPPDRSVGDVRTWHETDMPKYLGDIRCWVNSGKHFARGWRGSAGMHQTGIALGVMHESDVALSVGGQRLEILVGFGGQGKCEGAPPRRKASWMTQAADW